MKTAKEHRESIPLFQNLKWTPETIERAIEAIQLDASQSGYERGVREAAEVAGSNETTVDLDGCLEIKDEILSLLNKPKDEKV